MIELTHKLEINYEGDFETTAEPSKDEQFINRVTQITEQKLSESGFGVEQLAREINLSRAHLFRKLKAIIKKSPIDFINDMRLQRAAEMIRGRVDTLGQISYRVGFSDQSYFAKRFRRKFGISPRRFRLDGLVQEAEQA